MHGRRTRLRGRRQLTAKSAWLGEACKWKMYEKGNFAGLGKSEAGNQRGINSLSEPPEGCKRCQSAITRATE